MNDSQGGAPFKHRAVKIHQQAAEVASPVRVGVHHLGAHLVDFGSVRLLRGALPLLALDEFILQLSHPQLQLLHGRHFGGGATER